MDTFHVSIWWIFRNDLQKLTLFCKISINQFLFLYPYIFQGDLLNVVKNSLLHAKDI